MTTSRTRAIEGQAPPTIQTRPSVAISQFNRATLRLAHWHKRRANGKVRVSEIIKEDNEHSFVQPKVELDEDNQRRLYELGMNLLRFEFEGATHIEKNGDGARPPELKTNEPQAIEVDDSSEARQASEEGPVKQGKSQGEEE